MSNQNNDGVQSKKTLRMALSHKGADGSKSRDERVFQSPEVITVGTAKSCTFCITSADAPLPTESFVLIAPEKGEFRLQVALWMKGWVVLDEDGENAEAPKFDLSQKQTDSRFDNMDDGCAVTLTSAAKGKISIGSASILFQVIEEDAEESPAPAQESAHSGKTDSNALIHAPGMQPVTNTDLEVPIEADPSGAVAAAKAAALAAQSALDDAEKTNAQAQKEVDDLEEQIRRLTARLESSQKKARAAAAALSDSRSKLAIAKTNEQKAVEEEAQRVAAIEEARREEARRREAAALALQSLAQAEKAASMAVNGNAEEDEYEYEEEEDEGPLCLPTFDEMAAFSKDYLFALVVLVAFSLNAAFITAVKVIPMPEQKELTLEDIPERFAQVIIPDKPKDEPQVQDDTPAPEEKVAEAPKEAAPAKENKPAQPAIDSQKFNSKEERRAAIREGIQGKGLLKMLGALGGGGDDGDAIQDVLSGGNNSSNDIASALMGASGVGVATSETIAQQAGQRLGGGSGEAATIGSLGTTGGASAQTAKMEVKKAVVIKGRVIDEGPELESSDCDRNAIARYVRGRMKAIQNCYERELKKNPNLKGKVVVRFTIDEDGKVTEFGIEEESIGNTAVIACIRNTIRIWRFPIKDNSCPVAYPFIFAPSS